MGLSLQWTDDIAVLALLAELGVLDFQDVDDAGEPGEPLLELAVLGAEVGEFLAELDAHFNPNVSAECHDEAVNAA